MSDEMKPVSPDRYAETYKNYFELFAKPTPMTESKYLFLTCQTPLPIGSLIEYSDERKTVSARAKHGDRFTHRMVKNKSWPYRMFCTLRHLIIPGYKTKDLWKHAKISTPICGYSHDK